MWKLKNRFFAILSAFLILMAGSGIGAAANIIVHNGESIQAAVNNATAEDTIIVELGTYTEDIYVEIPDLIIKSKSGNANTIIQGGFQASDLYGPVNGVMDGFTFNGENNGSNSWICATPAGFSSCEIRNSKIIHYDIGMAAITDNRIFALNTQFIECGTGMSGTYLTAVGAENCQFIDCGVAMETGYPEWYYSINNVEIHTDASGKQVVTLIPDYNVEDPEQPPKPPANNTTTNPTTPEKPVEPKVPSNNTINNTTTPVETPAEPTVPVTTPIESPVETPVEDTGSSSGGSHHSSSSSGSSGGAGGSPEPAKNVASKEISQTFIMNGKPVVFNFPQNATCIEFIKFEAKKTVGKTTTIVEDLKNKSTLVSDLPEGIVYKSFNVWVGNAGYGNSKDIENKLIGFKVKKSWLQENNIDTASVALYRYDDENKDWVKLPVNLVDEDKQVLHFTAETPGFSSFVITGEKTGVESTDPAVISEINKSTDLKMSEKNSENSRDPGFGPVTVILIVGAVGLCCLYFYRKM
ncbi:PGF-pre-PGF domain-containing protein [Methanosarcina sp. 2.H.A.1B.4]|uniref:PGF-pre-PGF domain-containing protein n=1 Tax=Methanosarcina sp. 2.H.A.1B.4 TaxID=1483600 RepID=UPI0006213B54|nr:PGF-pre-PGF domain-containing protein [Methanosarcina sp. 2.H.A.1B.4]KKG10896.1 hypothetical protein EO92_00735 [Methanosarcina sp. 2.H.A.1B.4]